MTKIVDRLAVEIFHTHISSLSAAQRLAERLLELLRQEELRHLTILEQIQLVLSEPSHHHYLREVYHLTPQEALLLEHIIKREVLSLEGVMALLQVNNIHSRVVISRLRRKTGLPIVNYRGEGYAIRADTRKLLRERLVAASATGEPNVTDGSTSPSDRTTGEATATPPPASHRDSEG